MLKRNFKFHKNDKGEWWLILPEWKGDPDDLQMIEGADQWLDIISNDIKEVKLEMSDKYFVESETLTLLRIREENFGGGGIYYLDTYESKKVDLKLWLCDVTSFVFDCIPQKLFFKIIDK
ncbi:hypothetical protein FA048_13835 [Pedobacter polaris]|uniref:Uncharacterized protein n=1 Tax=Pedobacter polaris TaxID=2571273 RepID=A0A4U1CNG0_9SPHI|nr:DUF6717 family protein [Pedobacter polaris]TKC08233.1 hypothetical protein FA048_13835 [Pedobacter polaris]